MRTAIYCRISTDVQTVDQQEAACRALLRPEDTLVATLVEQRHGWDYRGSSEYTRLQEMVLGHRVDQVIVYRYDRLGRNTRKAYEFMCQCEDNGVIVRTVHQNIDTSTPLGMMFVHSLLTFAEIEREAIVSRTRAKFQAYREEFAYVGHGSMGGWFSEHALSKERTVRTLRAAGYSISKIGRECALDFRTVKKMLALPEGTLKSKAQVHAEEPGWYKTPAQQRAEFHAKHKGKVKRSTD